MSEPKAEIETELRYIVRFSFFNFFKGCRKVGVYRSIFECICRFYEQTFSKN